MFYFAYYSGRQDKLERLGSLLVSVLSAVLSTHRARPARCEALPPSAEAGGGFCPCKHVHKITIYQKSLFDFSNIPEYIFGYTSPTCPLQLITAGQFMRSENS